MNLIIDHLNAWGAPALDAAWAILWQSSVLIALLLLLEWSLGRKLRPGLRYGLWLIVLVKLVLPPSLALPTGVAWWVRAPIKIARPVHDAQTIINYGPAVGVPLNAERVFVPEPAKSVLSVAGAALAASSAVSLVLIGFLLWRWRQVARQAVFRSVDAHKDLMELLDETRASARVRRRVPLRLVQEPMSPALFGLVRPVILLPESLARRLSSAQLRPVLLHELIHYRRGDVWVNCAQALLQIVYWWHPLVWLANHRIRRAREEAVDEAVMLSLRGDGETYAPALVEVARLAFRKPLASLGLVGILESHGSLRQRIERLLDFQPPRRSGLTLTILCAATFGALALPMGQAPEAISGLQAGKSDAANEAALSPTDPVANSNIAEAGVMVRDGKLLFEMGKLEEAEKKLLQALRTDPRHQAAYYYLNLIREARSRKQPGARIQTTSPGRQRIVNKLQALQLEQVEFKEMPLDEVVRILAEEVRRCDPEGAGINFLLNHSYGTTNEPQAVDIGRVLIRVSPPLTNMRLADLLDAIVKAADQPIKYSVEDYTVVFSRKGNEPPQLYTRLIKVDPNAFISGLESVLHKTGAGDPRGTLNLFREFLASINVDLSPPKTIFWNDREGTIMVRATLQDLDTIETVIQVLNITPPQVNIQTRFLEMSEADEAEFWRRHPGASQTPSGVRTIQLTGGEAQKQLAEWASIAGVDVLIQPSVTTLSGLQAQVQVVERMAIVMFTNSPTPQLVTNLVPIGPILDVLPTLSADTLRFDLAIKASITEFLGYDDPGDFVVDGTQPAQKAYPIARFRSRQLPVTATVWDGHTLVIGGALDEQSQPADKPGDKKKRLLVVITSTVIDRAGNRLRTDEEVERARSKSGLRRDDARQFKSAAASGGSSAPTLEAFRREVRERFIAQQLQKGEK